MRSFRFSFRLNNFTYGQSYKDFIIIPKNKYLGVDKHYKANKLYFLLQVIETVFWKSSCPQGMYGNCFI